MEMEGIEPLIYGISAGIILSRMKAVSVTCYGSEGRQPIAQAVNYVNNGVIISGQFIHFALVRTTEDK